MAAQSPPFVNQASSHSAELFRRAVGSLLAPTAGGVVQIGDLLVSQHAGTPAMNVDIAAGEVWMPGTLTTRQGPYYALNDNVVTLTVAASDPTNPRLDRVCATANDAQYSGVTNNWVLQVITGTPAPSPAMPALPANSISLAQVSVAANATSVVNANITDLRTRLRLLSDPAIHCSVYRNAAWTTSAGPVVAPFDTKSWDIGGPNFTLGTNLFTCPVAGFYRVASMVEVISGAANQYLQASLLQNGATVINGTFATAAVATFLSSAIPGVTVRCAAGDTLGVYYTPSTVGLSGVTGQFTYATFDWAGSAV